MATAKDKIHYVTIVRPEGFEPAQIAEAMSESADAVEAGEKVAKESVIRLAMVTASRMKAYDRGEAQDTMIEWLQKKTGIEDPTGLDVTKLGKDDFRFFTSAWTACDIVGALVPEECEGWDEIPDDVLGWPGVDDYIYDPALAKARALNPHWASEARGALEGN